MNLSKVCFFGFFGLIVTCQYALADRIVLVAGGSEDAVGIPATQAKLKEPFGVDFDQLGNLWIIEMFSGNRLLKVNTAGVLTHVAGQLTAGFSGDGGPALKAQFHGPHNLAVDHDGNVYIGDTWNGRVRKVNVSSGQVTTQSGFEVPLDKAKGSGPYCITFDFTGKKLYVADLRRVSVIDVESGQSSVVAGNGEKGIPNDGVTAITAPLVDPRAVAADRLGNVYILERGGHALRVVDPQGNIRTVVNSSGKKGNDGDGGFGVSATMNGPKHLCIDRDNSVIIADAENNVVRRYNPVDRKITRIAGTGQNGNNGLGGDPLKCPLKRPHGVTVHPKSGELYITDSYNDRILKIVKE